MVGSALFNVGLYFIGETYTRVLAGTRVNREDGVGVMQDLFLGMRTDKVRTGKKKN